MPRLSRRRASVLDEIEAEADAETEDTEETARAEAAPPSRSARRQRIKPRRAKKRRDPQTSNHFDGSAEWTKLRNADPDVRYVFASMETRRPGAGVRYYEDLGYQVIEQDPDGVQLGAGCVTAEDGEPMEMMGTVLMGIHKDDFEDIKKYGPNGTTGLHMYDEIEKKILRPGGIDPLRGKYLKHLRQANDSSGLEVEV